MLYNAGVQISSKVVNCGQPSSIQACKAKPGQSECQLSGVQGGYKQYGGPILGRTMRVCRTKLENVENNERQFSCCEPTTWRPTAHSLPGLLSLLTPTVGEEYYQVDKVQ